MIKQLKEGTKIEAVAACMAGSESEFVTVEMLVSMLDGIGYKGSSVGSTRTCIARDFKRRKWARRKVISENVHYYLVPQFFKDLEPSAERFCELLPDKKKIIMKRFSDASNGKMDVPEFEEEKKDSNKFGGRQPPGLNINGCECSYSTLIKAIVCAQTEPFKKADIVRYANEVQIGLNQHSIGNGWYQVRKQKWLREVHNTRNLFEITNELLIENQRFFPDFFKILPNHVSFIQTNLNKAQRGLFRSKVDPVIEEPPVEEIEEPTVEATEPETETPIELETEQTEIDFDDIRRMALALGIIEEKPAIDPKIFVGECIVKYLEATSNGNSFTAVPKVKHEEKPVEPEKPIGKTEYVARLVELKGKMQTMETAKTKAENLAKQLSSANHDLKQQRNKLESDLNRLKHDTKRRTRLIPGESTTKVKLGSVARFT